MCAAVTASPVRYRPFIWDDVDTIVDAFDATWGNWGPTAGKPESRLLSRHFVLHYLEPATRGDIAEDRHGTFLGVTLSRVDGEPRLFGDIAQRLARVDAELGTTPIGSQGLRETLHWHDLEHDMEQSIGINDATQAELELFLVSAAARGRGVGGGLWRRLLAHFADRGVNRYYLHTDSSCDVSFYRHKGLDCVAERYASDHPEDNMLGGAVMDDIFIYAGSVPSPSVQSDAATQSDAAVPSDAAARRA